MATEICGVTAASLKKGFSLSESVTLTDADTDYPVSAAAPAWARCAWVYCSNAFIIAMGAATSATNGGYVAAALPTYIPIQPTGTAADDKLHMQSATAASVVRVTYLP
jgi:hypothetical protein